MKIVTHILIWFNLLLSCTIVYALFQIVPYPNKEAKFIFEEGNEGVALKSDLGKVLDVVSILEEEQIKNRKSITELHTSLFKHKYYPDLKDSRIFEPDSEGFYKIETGVGDLYVSLKNIEEYANGYKVSFQVGNPYEADILNAKASLLYGISYKEYKEQHKDSNDKGYQNLFDDWQNNLKKVEKSITEGFKRGKWNNLEFIITPAKSNELATLKLSLSADGLSLYEPKQ